MSCCNDFRYHERIGTVRESGALGFCVIPRDTSSRLLVPIYYCPWCNKELRPAESRPLGATYNDR